MAPKKSINTIPKAIDFNCPVCYEIPAAEIYQCPLGHLVCGKCEMQLSRCPVCRAGSKRLDHIRNTLLEQVLDMVKFECEYRTSGCTEKFHRNVLLEHQESCKFRSQIGKVVAVEQKMKVKAAAKVAENTARKAAKMAKKAEKKTKKSKKSKVKAAEMAGKKEKQAKGQARPPSRPKTRNFGPKLRQRSASTHSLYMF